MQRNQILSILDDIEDDFERTKSSVSNGLDSLVTKFRRLRLPTTKRNHKAPTGQISQLPPAN